MAVATGSWDSFLRIWNWPHWTVLRGATLSDNKSHCSAPLPHRTPSLSFPSLQMTWFSSLRTIPLSYSQSKRWGPAVKSLRWLCLSLGLHISTREVRNRLCCIYPPFFMLVCITYALLTVFGCSGVWILMMGVLAVPVFFFLRNFFFLVPNHSAICHTQCHTEGWCCHSVVGHQCLTLSLVCFG